MKIEATKRKLYKNYLIEAEAIEAPRLRGWRFRGIVYSRSRKELKKLEFRQGMVRDKKTGCYYALRMCRYWIDNRQTELERLLKRQRSAARATLKSACRFNRRRGRQQPALARRTDSIRGQF
jgi:hypothetical protein